MSENTENTETTDPNQSAVDDYFKIYDELDSEFDEEAFDRAVEESQARAAEAVRILEDKYPERGLKFTMAFSGSIPLQAFGTIDDMLFYFRFRGDSGSLRVGTIPEDWFERKLAKDIERWKENPTDPFGFEETKPTLQAPNGRTDMPVAIKKHSVINNYAGEPYNASLDKDEMVDLFSRLVEALEDVDYEW